MWGLPRHYVFALVLILAAGVLVYWGFFLSHGPDVQLLIAKRAPYKEQVKVSGTVRAAQDVNLGFAQSGRISRVYVDVGDVVAAGTLLAEIENGDLRASLAQRKASLQSAEAELASVKAGTRSEQLAVTEAQIQSDETARVQASLVSINAIQDAFTVSDDAVHNKMDKFFNDPKSAYPSLKFQTNNSYLETALEGDRVQAEALLAAWKIQVDGLPVYENVVVAESKALENLAVMGVMLSNVNQALNAAVYDNTNTETVIRGYIADIATARTSINAAQKVLTSAITSRKAAESALAKEHKNLELERAGSTQDAIEAQIAKVAAAQADVQSAAALLGKTQVTAPFSGSVTRVDASVGELVSPSNPSLSMVSDGLFEIELFVPELEIAGLALGNIADVVLDTYGPDAHFVAKVIAIDPAETVVNGVSTYKVTLQMQQPDQRIKPGMSADATITLQEVQGAILVPRGALIKIGNRDAVQLLRNGDVVTVFVVVRGRSQIGNVEVVSGISDGDAVILNPTVE